MVNPSSSNPNRNNNSNPNQYPNQNQNLNQNLLNANMINDPLYIASSDHPGIVLTNTPFNGSNFHRWSRNVRMALGAKLKLGFIYGSCVKPDVGDVELQRWIRCDYMVTCWILNSMQKQVTNHTFEPTAFFANMNNKGQNAGRNDSKGHRIGGKRYCTGCNQEGHTVDQCFEKIRYPDWYKGKNAKKQGRIVAHVNSGKGIASEGNAGPSYAGAFDHMTPNFSLFITVTYLKNPIIVHLPDVEPSFCWEIVSNNQLVAHFYPNDFCFQDLSTNQIVAVGKGSRCLYICKPTVDPTAFSESVSEFYKFRLNFVPSVSLDKQSYSNSVSKNVLDVHTFHARLGHSSSQPKIVRSDNGTEIVNTTCAEFFQSKGVLHQKSMAYTPQQNERVERKHRHLLDTARAIRSHANLPIRFWGDCILAATYLINKMPVKVLDWKTPFEKLYGKPPTYDYLRVIGCLCYDAVTKPRKDKFDDRGIKCVLLGYPTNQKGYKLYNWESNEVFLSKYVIFEENEFPFKHLSPSVFPKCPSLQPTFETNLLNDTESVNPNTPLSDNNFTPTASSIPTPTPVLNVLDPTQNTTIPPIRKSNRQFARYVWLKDFVTPKEYLMIILLANVFAITEPISYKQANKEEGWIKAMNAELAALEKNETWILTTLPPGHKAITSKWVYKIKYLPTGIVDKLKARLVLLKSSLFINWMLIMPFSIDILKRKFICYHLKAILRLYLDKYEGIEFTAVLVYVDDMLITRNTHSEVVKLKASLDQKFTIKDLGLAKYFLGTKLCRTKNGTHLNQRKYILDLLSDAGLTGTKPGTFPLPTKLKLSLDKGTPFI
uniref:Integrase catalytic domain-containing protein n=1 Tax=Tanacetum cinerariifolium TaxID=118510 RepID=A0A699GVF2_TANCI|nr:hypothetical protein [Tanacetum cinerariifolium]